MALWVGLEIIGVDEDTPLKKVAWIPLVIGVVWLALTGVAGAAPASWTDQYIPSGGPVLLSSSQGPNHYGYDHVLDAGDGFIVGTDWVLNYNLSLKLYDDCDKASEYALIDLPGLWSDGIYEIDYHNVNLGVSVAGLYSLNKDGTLSVDIYALCGDFYFGESTLTACGVKNSPVPIPGTAVLLGSGVMGVLALVRGRRSRRKGNTVMLL